MDDLTQLEHIVRQEYLDGQRDSMSLRDILNTIERERDKRKPRGFSRNTKTSQGMCLAAAPYLRDKLAERKR